MNKSLELHLLVRRFWLNWATVHYTALITNSLWTLFIFITMMIKGEAYELYISLSPLYVPFIIRYIKTIIYIFPWKYSYWNYKKMVHWNIKNYKTKSEFESKLFNDFISGNKATRGAILPIAKTNFWGFKSNTRLFVGISYIFYVAIFCSFQGRLKLLSTINQGNEFSGKKRLLLLFIIFGIYDPFFWGVEETYRFTRLLCYANYASKETSTELKSWYLKSRNEAVYPDTRANVGSAKYEAIDIVSTALCYFAKYKPSPTPTSSTEYKNFIKEIRNVSRNNKR